MRSLTTLLIALLFTIGSFSSPNPPPAQCGLDAAPHPVYRNLTTCLDSSTATPPSSWHPWTHKPYCTPSSSTPWCVFTRASSPAAHGLSVITTPDEASAALNPLLHALDAPFFAPEKLMLPRPYEVRDIPGKGKGAIATRRIEKGRAVLVDYASIFAVVEYPADVMREEVRELLRVAAAQLGEPEEVEGLSRRGRRGGRVAEEEEGEEGMSVMEDVMLTNSFGTVIGGKEYMGLFTDLARFNHACEPNAFIHFSETTLSMTVWSARDIEPEEEITITYTGAGLTSKERHKSLENVWGFKCQCSLCTAPPVVLKASDTRREEIRRLQDKVVELAQQGRFSKAIEAAERLFTLVDEEGLTEQMGDMYEVPARLYYHVGNLEKALEYTLKVRHEIDGYGVPGTLGEQKIEMLKGVIARIEREITNKQEREGSS
ncbi:SET domain-containing protein [Parathielavia appendiculata]|uniref:SET domain-containing protein n=1 Tax=Parathielavia appendiculata TaxID=2587402 RepID=A0AAN6TS51_9PEZI|nr:SET domain-containing protein [Parathielavia appendiculata]